MIQVSSQENEGTTMLLPHLSSDRISLRPLRRSDIPTLQSQANDKSISKSIPSIDYPYTMEHARRWVNCTRRLARQNTACHLGIERPIVKGLVGIIGIKNLNGADRNGELECWLGREFRGQSYASEAVRLMLNLAFNDLQLHRLYAIVAAWNGPSIKLLERHGFVREAIWREATWSDNRWHDVYGYGMLEPMENMS